MKIAMIVSHVIFSVIQPVMTPVRVMLAGVRRVFNVSHVTQDVRLPVTTSVSFL